MTGTRNIVGGGGGEGDRGDRGGGGGGREGEGGGRPVPGARTRVHDAEAAVNARPVGEVGHHGPRGAGGVSESHAVLEYHPCTGQFDAVRRVRTMERAGRHRTGNKHGCLPVLKTSLIAAVDNKLLHAHVTHQRLHERAQRGETLTWTLPP